MCIVTSQHSEVHVLCDRREFLAQLAALSASLAVGPLACQKTPKAAARAVFDDDEWNTLQALVDHMLPRDRGPDGDEPGAQEAGCARFVSAQLGQKQFYMLRKLLRRGLRQLDVQAQQQAVASFAELEPAAREQALQQVHALRQRRFDGGRFVQVMLVLILEGFLSDPRHGGNRGGVGWKFADFSPVRWGPDDGRGSPAAQKHGAAR